MDASKFTEKRTLILAATIKNETSETKSIHPLSIKPTEKIKTETVPKMTLVLLYKNNNKNINYKNYVHEVLSLQLLIK